MNPVAQALSRYKSVQVTTSSPGELLLMLFDGLFRFLNEAKTGIATRDRARAGERINRCHQILEHLLAGLDPATTQKDLYESLSGVYMFCMSHLVQANLRQDTAVIDEVLEVLAPLRDAWVTVVRSEETAKKSA